MILSNTFCNCLFLSLPFCSNVKESVPLLKWSVWKSGLWISALWNIVPLGEDHVRVCNCTFVGSNASQSKLCYHTIFCYFFARVLFGKPINLCDLSHKNPIQFNLVFPFHHFCCLTLPWKKSHSR